MAETVHRIIEKQMNFWRLQRQASALARAEEFVPADVATVSNAHGSNGTGVARLVGEALDFPVYDREIVEHIATTESVQVETVETLDQVVQGRMDDYTTALFRERNFDESDYLKALTRTIMALWGHGPCVLLGRGAAHIVSRKHSLAVRIIASLPARVSWLVRTKGISQQQALQDVRRVDSEREAYIRRHFDQDINNPLVYDLVINRTGMRDQSVADLIVLALGEKLGP